MPRFQFSLRSLLIFTLFVAVLCSIGVCTHWIISAVIGIGGMVGRIAARRDLGFLVGGIYGTLFGVIAFLLSIVAEMYGATGSRIATWPLAVHVGITLFGAIAGGVRGGLTARRAAGK
jgi:hypothetical protein